MTVVGEASILIRPVTTGFEAELRKETDPALTGFRRDAEKAGEDAGAGIRTGTTKQTGKLAGDLEKHGNAAGSALSSGIGKGLLVVGAAAAGAAVEAAHLGEQMQSADAAIAAAAGTSVKSATRIGDAFLDTAGKSEFSAEKQAQAFAAVAGQLKATEGHALDAAQASRFMAAAGDLATAKQIDLGDATSATAGIMQAFHLSTKDAADVTDALFAGSTATGQSVDALASSIEKARSRLGPTAGSVQDLTGLLVDMTKAGVTGRAAMSGLNSGMTALLKPTTQGAQAAKILGLETFNSAGKFVGLQSVITQLAPKFARMNQQQQLQAATMIFGAGAARQMLAVINAGPSAYDRATQAVSKHGSAQAAAAKQTSTLHGQEQVLGAEVTNLATRIGSVLIPVVTAFTAGIIHASTYVTEHKTLLIALAAVVTGVLGTAIAVFTVNKMAQFGNSFVSASGHVKNFVGDVQTGVSKVIGLFGKQADAADAMATNVQGATTKASTATAAEATSVTESTATIEGDNAKAGGSFSTVATEAQAAEVKIGTAEAATVTEVTAADTTIEAENTAAKASFAGIGLGAAGIAAGGLAGGPGGGQGDELTSPQGIYQFLLGNGMSPAQALAQVRQTHPGFTPSKSSSSASTSSGSVGAQGIPPAIANTNFTPSSFAVAAMESLGITPTAANIRDFTAWENQEGGNWKNSAKFNPLNTTMPEPGAGNTGSQGNIKVYQSWAQGLQATVATLKNYPTILAALRGGASSSAFSAAVANSPWGTGSVSAAGSSLSASQINALENLLSGGTSTGSAGGGSTRTTSKGGFKADPGTQQTEGDLPTLTARLNALAKSRGDTIYGISGYRSPAHSVAVGGFADDPHTKGLAEDIGVNSQLRSSAAQLSNAELAKFGLERTFDKSGTNPNEVNHIQLIPGWTGKLPTGVSAINPAQGAALTIHTEATKAQIAAAKQEASDTKAGVKELTGLVKDVHSTNLKQLTSDLNKTHNAQLGALAHTLENDGSASNAKLANELIKVHTAAMDQFVKESVAAAQKAATAALVTKLDRQSKVVGDQAKASSDKIADLTKVYLDQQAQTGLSGAALTAAQAQTSLDEITTLNDQAIDSAQTKVDKSSNGSALVQAQAAEGLAQAQATATVQEATAQSVLDKANALANAAAATPTDTSSTTDTAAPATAPTVTYNFQIFGNGTLTSSDLFREVGWALTTGALPIAQPAVGAPAAATAG